MKTHYSFFLLISFCLTSCEQSGQNQQNTKRLAADSTYIVSDSSVFKLQSSDPLVNVINIYSDSINNASKSGSLPLFLNDAQSDYNNAAFSILHHPAPLRKMIFDKVTNCESLKMIITLKDSIYQIHPKTETEIDVKYLEYSMWDLAMKRYKELKCN